MTGVKKVERFQTSNGRLFEDLAKAEEHELIDSWAKDVIESLGGRRDSDFVNGEGTIVISEDRYTSAQVLYEDILGRLYNDRHAHPRMIDDDNMKPPSVGSAASMFRCIKKREYGYERYGQPFYMLNPDKMHSREVLERLV